MPGKLKGVIAATTPRGWRIMISSMPPEEATVRSLGLGAALLYAGPLSAQTNFHKYVALGDSFTEGVGDPDPGRPNGLRGWADRVAEGLATRIDVANLIATEPEVARVPIVVDRIALSVTAIATFGA